jgi:heat shock protein HslJ
MRRSTTAAVIVAAVSVWACSGSSTSPATPSSPSASTSPSAAASPSAGSSLTGQPWALSAVTRKSPAFQGDVPAYQQHDYTVTFDTDGTYSGTAACNQIAGTYESSGDSLTITAGASTLAFCPQVASDTDFGTIFAHALTDAATYAVTDETLTITLSDGGTMTFGSLKALPSSAHLSGPSSLPLGANPPAELLGKVWKLTGITESTPAFQGMVPEADQSRYTVEFQADRTFKATADCNQVSGTFEVWRGGDNPDNPTLGPPEAKGGHLAILPGPSTLAACPPGSLADLFVLGLGNASGYGIADDHLTLEIGGDGIGKLQFID